MNPLGVMLREQSKNTGANGIGTSAIPKEDRTPTLADAGIDKKLSSRAQNPCCAQRKMGGGWLMVTIEFYKSDVDGIERVTETLRMPRFADRASFVLWAQIAFANRRGSPDMAELPEAVRAVDESGKKLFQWSDRSQL